VPVAYRHFGTVGYRHFVPVAYRPFGPIGYRHFLSVAYRHCRPFGPVGTSCLHRHFVPVGPTGLLAILVNKTDRQKERTDERESY